MYFKAQIHSHQDINLKTVFNVFTMAYKVLFLSTISLFHSLPACYTLATLTFSVHSFNILIHFFFFFTSEALQLPGLSHWNVLPSPLQMASSLSIFRAYSNVTSTEKPSRTILSKVGKVTLPTWLHNLVYF